jgi:ATP/ADP translocase
MSKWAYAGIILSLIMYSLIILNSFVLFYNKKDFSLSYMIIIQITLVIGIIGCAFTLQRTTLPCDDKYVCKDSETKETFMKISSIISIIFASLFILVTLQAIFFGQLQM